MSTNLDNALGKTGIKIYWILPMNLNELVYDSLKGYENLKFAI